jgi:hypothetical protein
MNAIETLHILYPPQERHVEADCRYMLHVWQQGTTTIVVRFEQAVPVVVSTAQVLPLEEEHNGR